MFLISGNVGQEAQVKEVSGKFVVEYSVAVYAGKDKESNSLTLWVKCGHWFNQRPSDYLVPTKGDGVIVTGIPSPIRIWEINGKQGTELSVMVNSIEYTKRGSSVESAPAPATAIPAAAPESDNLPF